ncbi:MAG: hypothetical protein ABTQ24_05085 [Azonexus sp.]|jgi:hypothetical protein
MRAYWAFGENRGAHNRYTPSTEGGKGMAIGMTHTQALDNAAKASGNYLWR